jgi:phage baseplate assembly protein W
MATFKGFTTIGRCKKFSLTDNELIKRDLLNSFTIREGQLPGRPEFGTRIWDFIFEPGTQNLLRQITAEVNRVASYDPRVEVTDVNAVQSENGVEVEVSMVFQPDASLETLILQFDEQSETVDFG